MTGLCPTGILANTLPKPTASIGLVASQFGFDTWADGWHSGMLMMLREPTEVPLPAFATSSSVRVGARSAQMGATPTGMVVEGVEKTVPMPLAVAVPKGVTVEPIAERIVVPVGMPLPETDSPAVNPAIETAVII